MSGPLFKRLINDAFDIPVSSNLEAFQQRTFDLVCKVLQRIVQLHTGDYPNLTLLLGEAVRTLLYDNLSNAASTIETLLDAESAATFTLDSEYSHLIQLYRTNMFHRSISRIWRMF